MIVLEIGHLCQLNQKRYKILDPERTDSNIRTYNESELKKILNVAYLNRNGLKISKIALLSEDELTQKVMAISSKQDDIDQSFQPGKILMSAIRFNEDQFKDALAPFIKSQGIEEAYIKYLYPLLLKSRILWQTGSLSRAQEQFIMNTIKQIIIVEDNSLKTIPAKLKSSIAMINITGNLFDNNYLFYKYALKKRGFDVIFTGGILPASELIEIHKIKPFKNLAVNSGAFDFAEKKFEYFGNLSKSLNLNKIIFTDYPGLPGKIISEKIIITKNPQDFINKISLIR